MFLDGEWHKVSSAFNVELCQRFGTKVLEWDGHGDALMHPYDESGRRHMEYVHDRGMYRDLPLDDIFATFDEIYGTTLDNGNGARAPNGDSHNDDGHHDDGHHDGPTRRPPRRAVPRLTHRTIRSGSTSSIDGDR